MAKAKNTGATSTAAVDTQNTDTSADASTGNGEQAPDKGAKGGRGPGNRENDLYFNDQRDEALMLLVGSRPGQLTSKQVAQALADHPAFADQRDLILTGAKHESFRQRLMKLNKRWTAQGLPDLELRRLANTSYDVDAVVKRVAAALYGSQGPTQSQPQGQGQVGVAPLPVAAGGFTGGLIPTA